MLSTVLAFAVAEQTAKGGTITFTDITTASGTIGATSFSDAAITVSGAANTASITTPHSGVLEIVDTSTSVFIGGLGIYNFTTPVGFFVNNTFGIVGFQRSNSADLIDGPDNTDFATWEMNASIGPITGTGSIFQWDSGFGAVDTTGGQLILDNSSPNITFSATFTPTTTPEPGTLVFVIAGLGAFVLIGRTRRNRSA